VSGRPNALFAFAPELVLAVHGPERIVEEFRREYRLAKTTEGDPTVEVSFTKRAPAGETTLAGGHKTVRWRVGLSAPDRSPLRAEIALSGVPATFARSLVQGYYVEPLLALVAARAGRVLLPAAGFDVGGAATLVMGSSRTGKSTLAARVGARGGTVLGDDQVLLGAAGCSPFPRRTRIYSDFRRTASDAYRSLTRGERAALLVRAVARRLTLGWVAPSLAVELPAASPNSAVPLARVALIERDAPGAALDSRELATTAAVEAALSLLGEHREWLTAAPGWHDACAAAARRERATLSAMFSRVPVEQVPLPEAWGAAESIAALERHLTLNG